MFIIEWAGETGLIGCMAYLVLRFTEAGPINEGFLICIIVWAGAILLLINMPPKKKVDKKPAFGYGE